MKYDLSVLIPSRNEMFLSRTVDDLLDKIRGNTEIIVVLDGCWADPPLKDHPRVTIIHNTEPKGQRAATNQAAKLSEAKYVAKVDAHCSFDEGFDVKLMADMQDDWTMVPIMRNLWAFNWLCKKCSNETYQGPTPTKCVKCDNTTAFERKMYWVGKLNPQSTSYCFDSEPHFQYFREYRSRPEYQLALKETGLTETMSLQGSFFMCTRDKYWELNLCDESFGSWGNQGIEVAMKTRISGGKVIVSHKTWYAHMFRTQGGDFGFPYSQPGRVVQNTKTKIKDLLFNNMFDKAIYPISAIIDQFWPVPGWTEEQLKNLKAQELQTERSGIYSIKNTNSGKVYFGSSINISNSIGEHLRSLERNDHPNTHLQSSWNKHGKDSFIFRIERFCAAHELLQYEQIYNDRADEIKKKFVEYTEVENNVDIR